LNNEEILKQFEVIEQKVERVIEICKSHEATNLELTEKIRKLEEELQSKTEAEKHYQEDRTLIRSRIDSLLRRLDKCDKA
jgi:site-specific DNA-adenine methylase